MQCGRVFSERIYCLQWPRKAPLVVSSVYKLILMYVHVCLMSKTHLNVSPWITALRDSLEVIVNGK